MCFARRRAYCYKTWIFFGPVEGSVVWKLVADAYLPVVDLVLGQVINLTKAQSVSRDIDNQEAGIALGGVRRPSNRSFHITAGSLVSPNEWRS
jgi:hypothetical protein